jgi:hypothetical protein
MGNINKTQTKEEEITPKYIYENFGGYVNNHIRICRNTNTDTYVFKAFITDKNEIFEIGFYDTLKEAENKYHISRRKMLGLDDVEFINV